MTQHRHLDYDDELPESWLSALGEFVSTQVTPNALVQVYGQLVVMAAGPGNDQVGIAINGRWRWITAGIASNPVPAGTPAGPLAVWAVASDNDFQGSGFPGEEVDETDYSFTLALKAGTAPPSGAVLYRRIATAMWDGSKLVAVGSDLAPSGLPRTLYAEDLSTTLDDGSNANPHDPRCAITGIPAGVYAATYSMLAASQTGDGAIIGLILAINGAGVSEGSSTPRPSVTSPNAYSSVSLTTQRSITVPAAGTVSLYHAPMAGVPTPYSIRNRSLKLTRIG